MKKFALFLFFIFWLSAVAGSSLLRAQDLKGRWEGNLSFSGNQIPLVFNIEEIAQGWSATLDSPSQGAFGIPVDSLRMEGDSLILLLPRMGVKYTGKVDPAYRTIQGEWMQGGLSLPLKMEKTAEEAGLKRPQEPEEPFPYQSENIRFENKEAGITLAGTFTRPEGEGQYPAVVLVSGSGPQDRDETIQEHKPFLILADYLTRQGIAVLRYDDRGFGQSQGSFIKSTTSDFASDAAAAVAYLQYRPDVKANQVGMLGHSEGGLIAPMVAQQGTPLAFMVLLAAPAVPGHELMVAQAGTLSNAQGSPRELVEQHKQLQGELLGIVLHEQDSLEAARKLQNLFSLAYEEMTSRDGNGTPPSQTQINAQVGQLLSPWYRNFIAYNPQPALQELTVPTLALYGGKDVQVPAELNKAALDTLRNEHIQLKEFPEMNHLFQPATSGLPQEYGQIETTIAPEVLETISQWIWEQLPQPTE